jgi:hypothetical protein
MLANQPADQAGVWCYLLQVMSGAASWSCWQTGSSPRLYQLHNPANKLVTLSLCGAAAAGDKWRRKLELLDAMKLFVINPFNKAFAMLPAAGDEWRRKLELLAALEVAVPAAAAAAHKVNKSRLLNKGDAALLLVVGFVMLCSVVWGD